MRIRGQWEGHTAKPMAPGNIEAEYVTSTLPMKADAFAAADREDPVSAVG